MDTMNRAPRPRRTAAPIQERPQRARDLRDARLAADFTQYDLALLAGIAQDTIAKYESGRLNLTDQRTQFLLAVIAGAAR